jgi:hypothetical protein
MGGTEHAEDYTFFCGKANESHEEGVEFFAPQRILSEAKRAEFVSDRSHIRCSEVAGLILF